MKIDTCDLELTRKHIIAADGTPETRFYASFIIAKKKRRFHWLLTGYTMTDHIDQDSLNNRRANLREATYHTNALNRRYKKVNPTGRVGVIREGPYFRVNCPLPGSMRRSPLEPIN